jgi:hypothetical protein
MRAGTAVANITPPVGAELSGGSFGPSRGVLHPLFARALFLEQDGTRLLLIACDLVGFDWNYALAVRRDIAREHDIPADAVMLTCTHTHSGPATATYRNWGKPDAAYRDGLRATLASLAGDAIGAACCARIGAGTISCPGVAVNRALGDPGATNDELGVIRVDGEHSGLLAVVLNYACHPVNLHSSGMISPDFPHFAEADLHAALGRDVPVLYLSGAGGDLNPANFRSGPGEAMAAETGGRIAAKALEALPSIRTRCPAVLAAAAREATVPLQRLPGEAELRAFIEVHRRAMKEERDPSSTNWDYCAHKTKAEWAEEALSVVGSGRQETSQAIQLQAFRVGDTAIVGVPGEPFAELGVAVARTGLLSHAFVVSQANGSLGYFPPRAAFELETYEAAACPRYTGLYFFKPGVGERILEGCLELVAQLAQLLV